MKAVTRGIARRFLGERGASAVEYALLIAFVAMAIVGAVYVLGARLTFAFEGAAGSLATPAPAPAPPPAAPGPVAPPGVDYENCDAVRAAGADPIHVGDPGYSRELDPDGDGVGCE
jgi:Flp pilus assembly pilin Flp